MNEACSRRKRRALVSLVGAVLLEASGCTSTYPVVANPTEPWEQELVRERQAAREAESDASHAAIARQRGDLEREDEKKPEHSAVVVALTDIIAFPFRGAGWLAQQIF